MRRSQLLLASSKSLPHQSPSPSISCPAEPRVLVFLLARPKDAGREPSSPSWLRLFCSSLRLC